MNAILPLDVLHADELKNIDGNWRAANYLSAGQIYLYDSPLLRQPLTLAHVKPEICDWVWSAAT